MKKRVVIARSNSIDPDSRVEKEANSLARNGYDVTLLAWDRSKNYKKKIDKKKLSDTVVNRVSFGSKAEFGVGMKNIAPFIVFQWRLFVWLIRNADSYDIAHLCDYDTAIIGSLASRIKKKKAVFDIFDYRSHDANTLGKKIFKRLEDHVINSADATIICTEKRRKQIQGTHPQRLIVVHNTPEAFRLEKHSDLSVNNELINVAYVGILQDYRLLKEEIAVISKMPDIVFHIGGFGKYEEYVKDQARLYPNIVFHGKLPYAETIQLESQCDIMLAVYDPSIPNHIYAAPNKFYEGLFLGKPLIMVNNTGMSEIVKKEKVGEIIQYSENGFREGLTNLIARRKEWESMSKRMRDIYDKQYNWAEMEKRLLSLYCDISRGNK